MARECKAVRVHANSGGPDFIGGYSDDAKGCTRMATPGLEVPSFKVRASGHQRYRSGTSLSVIAAATNENDVAHATRTSFDQTRGTCTNSIHMYVRLLIGTLSFQLRVSTTLCTFLVYLNIDASFHLDSLVMILFLPGTHPQRSTNRPRGSPLHTLHASGHSRSTRNTNEGDV